MGVGVKSAEAMKVHTFIVRDRVSMAKLLHLIVNRDFLCIAMNGNFADERVRDCCTLSHVRRHLEPEMPIGEGDKKRNAMQHTVQIGHGRCRDRA
jgi:hypothetical protein